MVCCERVKPHEKDKAERLTKTLKKQAEGLNWDGINFPTPMSQINVFENLMMVLGWDEKKKRVVYLRLPKTKHKNTVRIF